MPDIPFTANLSLDAYPERNETTLNWFDETVASVLGKLRTRLDLHRSGFTEFYQLIKTQLKTFKSIDNTEYAEQIAKLRYAMVRDGLAEEHIIHSFALVYYTIVRTLRMRPYKVQLMAGWVMMQGMLAEMETGEGKTLSATFPACTAALGGIPVHVITANDYLATRDAKLMQPIYQALGLSVGVVVSGMSESDRRTAYSCDMTYCTSKQLALDYLRDRLKQGLQNKPIRRQLQQQIDQAESPERMPLLRGLYYAIVDEADSVLIDDARVPLILAREGADQTGLASYFQALAIARLLIQDEDFSIAATEPRLALTDQGRQRLDELCTEFATAWAANEAEQLSLLALRALHLLERDKHYLVNDKGVQIIDENTGRIVADRSWQKGLQQLVECKEDCALSGEKTVLARISFQRFFHRYLHLAGMSGTAREVAGELHRTYELEVVTIPTRKPCRRKMLPERVYPHATVKWQACVKRIEKIHKKGRPILVGTRTIKDSEHLSLLLHKAQLPHQILNARQDEQEAKIIAHAGKLGQITIATNMAGRGTDIRLLKETKKSGGLHVISMELNDARRIDRQLYGRCARQGDRGSCEAIVSLDDAIFAEIPATLRQKLQTRIKPHRHLPLWAGRTLIRWTQWVKQRQHAQLRRLLVRWDRQQDQTLGFTGKRE